MSAPGGGAAPRASGLLDVGGGHRVYWEESGAPDGVPVLYLHGGPGGTLGKGGYRRRHDPAHVRSIGLDQRGCGRSTPHAADPGYDLAQNTTAHLITDLEALRTHLGIERWVLEGVSWGSTLALAYALAHPDRVAGVALLAVTTTARAEVDWITQTVGAIFPEAWDAFAGHAERATGGAYRRNGTGEIPRLVEAYARLMADPDPRVVDGASWAWARWEDAHIALGTPPGEPVRANPRWRDDAYRHAFVRLAAHYWTHDAFCDPPLLERIAAGGLDGVPGVLVHGRRDVSGPAVTAWRVHRAWSGSRLEVLEDEGHGGPRMVDALRRGVADLARAERDRSGQSSPSGSA